MISGSLGRCRVAALAVALLLGSVTAGLAAPEDGIVPLEQYTTPKAKGLASRYKTQLLRFSEQIYHCLPWVGVLKNGIGFRQPKGVDSDDRYLSVWIAIDQNDDGTFARLPQERRVSAMFSRYGVDMLRRMTGLAEIASDSNVHGFSVVLTWLKPGSNPSSTVQPTNETLALFAEKSSVLDFLAKRLPGAEFTRRAMFTVFDGKDPLGHVPLEVWEDSFNSTYKLKNYVLEKGVKCG